MAHHETNERYDGIEAMSMEEETEARTFFTIVVGLNKESPAVTRAMSLDQISQVHADTPRFILRLMCEKEPEKPNSTLVNMVEQISFYLDRLNNRGIYSGVIASDHLALFTSVEAFCKQIILETKLSGKADFSDIDGFSWVTFDLDELADPNGRLLISNANGSIGGR